MAATPEPPLAAPSPQEALSSLLCDVLPPQGAWSDREYLWLTDHTNRLIELADGDVEEFARGEAATSPSLTGFATDVDAVFDAPESGA